MASVAARPDANASPWRAPSSAARQSWSAWRVGFCVREYSNPLWTPGLSCTYVEVRYTGVITAPVVGSGAWPAWMARVSIRASGPSPRGAGPGGTTSSPTAMGPPPRARLLQPLAQELDEVDLGEDARHLLALLHHRDVVVVEDLAQPPDGRVGAHQPLDRLDERVHDLGEPVLPLHEEVEQVVLV